LNVLAAEDRALGGLEPNEVLREPSKRLLLASSPGDRASGGGPGVESSATPPQLVSFRRS
jgi:hypothetical protein